MELQWPLILFTSFIAWSAGIFATHGILTIRQVRLKSHLALLVTALVVMVIGGIAVFLHLEHWERIFNGFGHITSGITQELIGIVAMVVVMVVMYALLRRRDDDTLPVWSGVLAVIVAIALVVAMGHSYMMPSRPAWDSALQLLSLIGAACVMGPATCGVVLARCGDDAHVLDTTALIGAIVNAITTIGYLVAMNAAQALYTDIDYYYDPAHLARGMIDFESATGLLAGGRVVLVVLIVVFAVVPIVAALMLRKKKGSSEGGAQADAAGEFADEPEAKGGAAPDAADVAAAAPKASKAACRWVPFGVVMTLSGFACAVILRVVFYELGHAVYIFF